MASIKGKDTKPEMIVRRYLFSRGLRYRLQVRKLPGSPDIVLKKYKTVVFVDGCFWHGHQGCHYFRMPKSNIEFWERKISHNKARDVSNTAVLRMMGWRVIRIWECDIRTASKRNIALEKLYNQIVGLPKPTPAPLQYTTELPEISIAAEPPSEVERQDPDSGSGL